MNAILTFLNHHSNGLSSRLSLMEDMKRYAEMGVFPTIYVCRQLRGEEAADLESRIYEAMSLMKD
jgi:hypothetical protein